MGPFCSIKPAFGGSLLRYRNHALLGYAPGTRLGVWTEVKLQHSGVVDGKEKLFDYTFDYVIMPVGRIGSDELSHQVEKPWRTLRTTLRRAGYAISDDDQFVEDCPTGIPSIIEIMTSSTSGGNKRRRTTIPMSFEDVMLGKPHIAPSINYRQVWARMVSQLIVKSEVALAWGGKTIWIVQDVLMDYITASTALNIENFLADKTSEVNMLSFSYGDKYQHSKEGVVELGQEQLYAGPMTSGEATEPSFQDMIRAPICPPLSRLLSVLAQRGVPSTIITVS